MPDDTLADALIPTPVELTNLIGELVDVAYPATDSERAKFFDRVGFVSAVESVHDYGDRSSMFTLRSDLPGDVHASWTSHQGDFLGVALFAYSSADAADANAKSGYELVTFGLQRMFGPAAQIWEEPEAQMRQWIVTGKTVTVQLFDRRDSILMISINDQTIEAEAEDYARRNRAADNFVPFNRELRFDQ